MFLLKQDAFRSVIDFQIEMFCLQHSCLSPCKSCTFTDTYPCRPLSNGTVPMAHPPLKADKSEHDVSHWVMYPHPTPKEKTGDVAYPFPYLKILGSIKVLFKGFNGSCIFMRYLLRYLIMLGY